MVIKSEDLVKYINDSNLQDVAQKLGSQYVGINANGNFKFLDCERNHFVLSPYSVVKLVTNQVD